jgi:hypothetical protein
MPQANMESHEILPLFFHDAPVPRDLARDYKYGNNSGIPPGLPGAPSFTESNGSRLSADRPVAFARVIWA